MGGRGTPQEGNLTQRRGEAESAEWKIDTRESATSQNVSCRHGPPAWIACQLRQGEARRSTQSISALSASPRLCVRQKRRRARRRTLCPLNPMTPLNLTTPLNPIDLCALCLSAPLRESKTTTTRDSTNPLPSQPHAPLNPMNLCALCLSAPLREAKTTTTRDSTDPLPTQPPCPLSISRPLSTQSISALSASPRLCVSQKDDARDAGRRGGGRRILHLV